MIFKSKFQNWLYDADSWSRDFKVFFPLKSDNPITLLCLIVGVDSISKVLVVLEKTNNVAVRCHLCWVPFLRDGIFDKRSALSVILSQWVL